MKTTNSQKGFAQLPTKMIYSKAFNSLSGKGHILIGYILNQLRYQKTKGNRSRSYGCLNSNSLLIPYRVLKKEPFKMANSTITKSIDELLAKGFVKIVEQGGREKGHVSVYGLSEKYLQWQPGDAPVSVRRPYAKRGFCSQAKKEV